MADLLYMIIPCYNEEEILPYTSKTLREKLNSLMDRDIISRNSKIIFVDDGSTDNTWNLIQLYHSQDSIFTGISLAHNSGEQYAHVSGMMTALENGADFIISMDADLQDDVDAMDEMIQKYKDGCEIVYGVRKSRDVDTFFKKFTAELFYKTMQKMGTEIIPDHSQYRLMSRRAIEAFSQYQEEVFFLSAVVPTLGFKNDIVYYDRKERIAGETKYPVFKLIRFARDCAFSLNYATVKLLSVPAVIFFIVSIISFIVAIVQSSSTAVILGSVWMIGAFIMLGLRIVGEYASRAHREAQKRPRYIIDKNLFDE